ncbi:hypothetical protein P280DRAFT_516543 [Massarina eburnea CBS 473.64]|uniref:Uncharacterized protein n=1 Tax=Massarina eburnea CBS 473.64 TaxID=1395130 RepID=A0A6A6S8N1_9PLEO|nr:hypothetical protein P280DRAFT_516543 [Massarina eburnea CBS 473.64]
MSEFSAKVSTADLQEFEGVFTWDDKALKVNIQATKPDYLVEDPATWPRISATAFHKLDGGPFNGTHGLPHGIVYPWVIIHGNFGNQREDYGTMTEGARKHYKSYFTNNNEQPLPMRPALRPTSSPRSLPTSPISAFNEVMNMLRKKQITAKEIHGYKDLKNELDEAKHTLSQERKENVKCTSDLDEQRKISAQLREALNVETAKTLAEAARANAAEDKVKLLEKQYQDTLEVQMEKANEDMEAFKVAISGQLEEEILRTAAAQDRIKELELQAKAHEDDLATSRNETIVANERVLVIWEQMRKEEDTDLKRKASNVGNHRGNGVGRGSGAKRPRF